MMVRGRHLVSVAAAFVLAGGLALPAAAATHEVAAAPGALARELARASAGDVLILEPGQHDGPVILGKSITLEGRDGAVLAGSGEGSVIRVEASGVAVRNLMIAGSGRQPMDYDAGIYVAREAKGFVAERNQLQDVLFGIVLHGADGAVVRGNRVKGRTDAYMTERGNAIHLQGLKQALIEDNQVSGGRDGLFLEAAHEVQLIGNRMEGVRFAVHSMFANKFKVERNVSRGNEVGFALMYSNEISVVENVSDGDHDHGLMLHSVNKGRITDNLVRGTHDKCSFFYTSNRNLVSGNRFENCGIGLHFTGSDDNTFIGNAFIGNQTQVKFAGTQHHEWSAEGRGNYWSDNPGFDLNGDGTADTAYRPNTAMDRIVWKYPLAKLLLSSPAMETLRFAQSVFPALFPGGVVDSHPLMAPPPVKVTAPQYEVPS